MFNLILNTIIYVFCFRYLLPAEYTLSSGELVEFSLTYRLVGAALLVLLIRVIPFIVRCIPELRTGPYYHNRNNHNNDDGW